MTFLDSSDLASLDWLFDDDDFGFWAGFVFGDDLPFLSSGVSWERGWQQQY